LDIGLFRLVNQTSSNPVFDVVMPFASGNRLFIPAVLLVAALLLWKGGVRGRLCVLMLILIVWPGDSFVCNTIKHAVARPRPFVALEAVRRPDARGGFQVCDRPASTPAIDSLPPSDRPGYSSMPSSHAANWFAAAMVMLFYYRRSWRFMVPMACLVAASRLYLGVHYPSDVLAGAILGAGYASAGVLALDGLWRWMGRSWFPLWWARVPSLVLADRPGVSGAGAEPGVPARETRAAELDGHWLRLGYVLIGALLLFRLAYLAAGVIELTGDEAYQWIWSKHLALSYYSKPPLIAWVQFAGTHLWGDNEFGVRFFSPIIASVLGVLLLRFFAREASARAGFVLLLIISATPLMALGSLLMTVDPLSVLFWTCAMMSGWRAVQPEGKTAAWLWTGLWMGLGFLSKYTELFQWLCWAVFFILWKPARAHLRRRGPYLALLVNLACAVPVLVWNDQHGWITLRHVGENAALGNPWHPTLRYFFDFAGSEAAMLNPVFFGAALWACAAFWRRRPRDVRMVFLFSMGAPLFLSYWLYSFHSAILPNWIAPSVLPLFCLMVLYWDARWRAKVRAVGAWLGGGLALGLAAVVLLHDTDLVAKLAGRPLPPKPDPLTRARGYQTMAGLVEAARINLLKEGKPVFIIAGHYQTAGLVTFYIPEARTNAADHPLVYFLTSDRPVNQFYFWPGYRGRRTGQNAIFVQEIGGPPLVEGWVLKWLEGGKDLLRHPARPLPPPRALIEEFDSVKDLGLFEALHHGRVFHTVQLFECRNLH
jgi:4-amino-4-deoxy-L-arabinose transferase-like glycosyltransferase